MRYEYKLTPQQVLTLQGDIANPNKAYQFAKLMETGIEFPPVQIWFDEKKNKWCFNDGRTRVLAAKMVKCGLKVKSAKKMGGNYQTYKI